MPDVVVIHCHDLGRHLGCYGAATVASPHLDALAAEGVLLEQMFAAAPQCSPSRAALFTGRWPHTAGVLGLTHHTFGWDLNAGEKHLARHLGEAGYRTELVGVMHEARRGSNEQIAAALGIDRVRTGGRHMQVAEAAEEAVARLAGEPEPYYLQVGFSEPHRLPGEHDAPGVMGFLGDEISPDQSLGVQVPAYLEDTASAREEVAELQGAIRAMDSASGRVLAAIEAGGRAHNTVVVFTTDHGLALPRAKCSLYDPGLEVAFIVRWPAGGWDGGRRLHRARTNIDVVPTLLDALGLESTDAPPMHGESFAADLGGALEVDDPEEVIYGEMTYHDYYDPRRCIRTPRAKLIVNFTSAPEFMDPSQSWNRRCVPVERRNGNAGSHPTVELYDLLADPLELTNMAEDPAYAQTRADLLRQLGDWMLQTQDPLLDGAVTSPLHQDSLKAVRG
ncbi:sulfatase [Ruania alkalisoli]|uniref:Sulfatase n=1 Tax=Ruania alkalisoli TaxID=2779775 RepID=A0A7M1SYB5_9MICO|nr:sulfatase [Ruania alkalisoli]